MKYKPVMILVATVRDRPYHSHRTPFLSQESKPEVGVDGGGGGDDGGMQRCCHLLATSLGKASVFLAITCAWHGKHNSNHW